MLHPLPQNGVPLNFLGRGTAVYVSRQGIEAIPGSEVERCISSEGLQPFYPQRESLCIPCLKTAYGWTRYDAAK